MKACDVIPPGQLRILGRIQTFIQENGYPPTLREIADSEGCRHNNIWEQLRSLQAKGLITGFRSGQARALVPTCRIERIPS